MLDEMVLVEEESSLTPAVEGAVLTLGLWGMADLSMIVPVAAGIGVDSLGAAARDGTSCKKTFFQSLQGRTDDEPTGNPFWRLTGGLSCDVS